MAETPPLFDSALDGVAVDLLTSAANAASAAEALLNENDSDISTEHNFSVNLVPATPRLDWKLPSSSDSESDTPLSNNSATGATSASNGGRPASPPPKCAICLCRCKNKCFTDSCMHQFCFKCLCEWSKVKPECPLCKQTFKSIIHNVKSMDQFEEYHVPPPIVQLPHTQYNPYVRLPIISNFNISVRNWSNMESGNSRDLDDLGQSIPTLDADRVQYLARAQLVDLYRRQAPDGVISPSTMSQLWRRYIYDRKLYALPVCDVTGRFRESTSRFYRDNPGQVHRLIPFINRDLDCLLRDTSHEVATVLEIIHELLNTANIISPSFRRRLQPFLGVRTSHFIHELYNFARSPYDMIGYDRSVQYSRRVGEEVVIEFLSSGTSDDEQQQQPPQPSQPNGSETQPPQSGEAGQSSERSSRGGRRRNRNNAGTDLSTSNTTRGSNNRLMPRVPPPNMLSFTITTTSEGNEAPGVSFALSNRGNTQMAAINLSTHNRNFPNNIVIDLDETPNYINPTTAPANTTATSGSASTSAANENSSNAASNTATSANVNNDDSVREVNSDLTVTLPSSVPPSIIENIELLSSTSSDECEFVLERKPPHLRTPEYVSLNSASDSDVVFVDEIKSVAKPAAVSLSTFTYSTSENEIDVVTSNINGGEIIKPKNSKKQSSISKAMAAASALLPNNVVEVEHFPKRHSLRCQAEVFNTGASTSKGLRSSAGSMLPKVAALSGASTSKRKRTENRRSTRINRKQTLESKNYSTDSDSDNLGGSCGNSSTSTVRGNLSDLNHNKQRALKRVALTVNKRKKTKGEPIDRTGENDEDNEEQSDSSFCPEQKKAKLQKPASNRRVRLRKRRSNSSSASSGKGRAPKQKSPNDKTAYDGKDCSTDDTEGESLNLKALKERLKVALNTANEPGLTTSELTDFPTQANEKSNENEVRTDNMNDDNANAAEDSDIKPTAEQQATLARVLEMSTEELQTFADLDEATTTSTTKYSTLLNVTKSEEPEEDDDANDIDVIENQSDNENDLMHPRILLPNQSILIRASGSSCGGTGSSLSANVNLSEILGVSDVLRANRAVPERPDTAASNYSISNLSESSFHTSTTSTTITTTTTTTNSDVRSTSSYSNTASPSPTYSPLTLPSASVAYSNDTSDNEANTEDTEDC